MATVLPTVPALSKRINRIVRGETLVDAHTAIIVSLSMLMKKRSETYDEYITNRMDILRRLTSLTYISPDDFNEAKKYFTD